MEFSMDVLRRLQLRLERVADVGEIPDSDFLSELRRVITDLLDVESVDQGLLAFESDIERLGVSNVALEAALRSAAGRVMPAREGLDEEASRIKEELLRMAAELNSGEAPLGLLRQVIVHGISSALTPPSGPNNRDIYEALARWESDLRSVEEAARQLSNLLRSATSAYNETQAPPPAPAPERASSSFGGRERPLPERSTSQGAMPVGGGGFVAPADPGQRNLSVDIYLATDDELVAGEVFDRVDRLLRAVGLARPHDVQIFRGSFFRKAWARIIGVFTSAEIQDRLAQVERGVELWQLGIRQAEVDKRTAEALSDVLDSLADIPQACIRIGSLLIVKHAGPAGPVVLARQLSQLELSTLERFPELQNRPERILEALAMAISSATVPSGE